MSNTNPNNPGQPIQPGQPSPDAKPTSTQPTGTPNQKSTGHPGQTTGNP